MGSQTPSRVEVFLRKHFNFKEIGWEEIGEKFTRYVLLKTKWFSIYVHQLWAPSWHPECHDHPWWFLTLLLKGGYLEKVNGKNFHRHPGMVLYRPGSFSHNVITPYGVSWSLIIAGPKSRDWGFRPCDRQGESIPWDEYRETYHAKV